MRLTGLLILLFGVVCAEAQTVIFVPAPTGENFIESELISEVSFLPLEIERYGMITPDMELKVDGEDYFILDNKFTQGVYHFGASGELLSLIGGVSEVQTEENLPNLTNPAKFNLNPYQKEVEIYSFENSEVTRYNYDGTMDGKISFSYNPSDFVRDHEGNYYIYTGWNSKETQYRLIKTSSNGMPLDRKMRLISKCTPIEGFSFYIDNDKIYMWEPLGNLIYSLSSGKQQPEYRLDYGANSLPLNYHMLNSEDSFQLIHEMGYYTVKKYVGNENYGYLFLNFSNMERREMLHVIHDKKSGQIYIYMEDSGLAAFDKAQAITPDNELVFLVSPRKIRRLLGTGSDFVPAPFIGLDEELRSHRNPILLKIKLETFTQEENDYNASDSLFFGN